MFSLHEGYTGVFNYHVVFPQKLGKRRQLSVAEPGRRAMLADLCALD